MFSVHLEYSRVDLFMVKTSQISAVKYVPSGFYYKVSTKIFLIKVIYISF